MPPAKPPKPTSPLPHPGEPDRRALVQAFQDVVRSEQEKRESSSHPAPPEAPAGRPFWIVMFLLSVTLGAILAMQPGWLFTTPVPETNQLQEASLRLRMFEEVDRINRFEQSQGRLPATLAEAGGDSTNLQYAPGAAGYSLSGRNGGQSLTYTSDVSPETFLGNSYQIIRQRSTR